ncbi:MAG TPA: zinc ribbon domain-containing protein [Syntrophales bacterium]|nr:zinc ribbon domain-containing protein [Syntrophales bacterium]
MPVYEFYCRRCNTIFNFFSRRVDTEKIPDCPRCRKVKLERQMSIFSRASRSKSGAADEEGPPLDEARMEKAMSMLANEAEHMNEEDPRQAAALMRKLTDATGLSLGPKMEEALRRMEKGEDPERIEEEMGDLLEAEDALSFDAASPKKGRKKARPVVDEKLYDL